MCTCSFACPSMKDIKFGEFAEIVPLVIPPDYMILYPGLCEEI